jgi:hypothetical protein
MTKLPRRPAAGKAVSDGRDRRGADRRGRAARREQRSVITSSASNITSSVPFGGTPVRKAAGTALDQLQTAAEDAQSALGTGSVRAAGSTIEGGLTGYAGKNGVLSQKVGAAYDKVDRW